MSDTATIDNMLDTLRLATRARPVDWQLVGRIKASLRELNSIDSVGVLTQDVYQVARRRLAQGYSLAEVASMTGLARSTVGNIRTGRRKPRKLGIRTPPRQPQIAGGV